VSGKKSGEGKGEGGAYEAPLEGCAGRGSNYTISFVGAATNCPELTRLSPQMLWILGEERGRRFRGGGERMNAKR